MKLSEELKNGMMVAGGGLVAAVLFVPFAVAQLILMPFAKRETPDDVAALLRKCIEGADDAEDEFDSFTSRRTADPRLNDIKTELVGLAGADWRSPEIRRKLQQLLRRVEEMPLNTRA